MSATVVNYNHIRYLVESIKIFGDSIPKEVFEKNNTTKKVIGSTLWDENVKSVSFYYPDREKHELPYDEPIDPNSDKLFVYEHKEDEPNWFDNSQFTEAQILKSIHEYMSETGLRPDFYSSDAFMLCLYLEAAIITVMDGADKAIWGAPEPLNKPS
jgi:hypothetical protein